MTAAVLRTQSKRTWQTSPKPVAVTVQEKVPIVVAPGDGVGPEIMDAVLAVLAAAGARLDIRKSDMGALAHLHGMTSGIDPDAWRLLRERRVLLKGPLATAADAGPTRSNDILNRVFGLYAVVRPCVAYAPYIRTQHVGMNVVVIRENEEDVYTGIEHRQTQNTFQCLRLITRPGCERIVRYAFEFARRNRRRKVSCFTKDNVMSMTDGLFHRVFDQIASDYPDIEAEHRIVDAGTALLTSRPELFDVVVLPNLYGDIVSRVMAGMTGSLGTCASANLGTHGAVFEVIHDSYPDLAGRNLANPSGLLLSAVMMLRHLGQAETAATIHDAWLATIEAGVRTSEVVGDDISRRAVGTSEFAAEVIARLGSSPRILTRHCWDLPDLPRNTMPPSEDAKITVGVDVFIDWSSDSAEALAQRVKAIDLNGFVLSMITNRGLTVWPNSTPGAFYVDHWRCRFIVSNGRASTDQRQILGLLANLQAAGIQIIKTENLCTFDGMAGYA